MTSRRPQADIAAAVLLSLALTLAGAGTAGSGPAPTVARAGAGSPAADGSRGEPTARTQVAQGTDVVRPDVAAGGAEVLPVGAGATPPALVEVDGDGAPAGADGGAGPAPVAAPGDAPTGQLEGVVAGAIATGPLSLAVTQAGSLLVAVCEALPAPVGVPAAPDPAGPVTDPETDPVTDPVTDPLDPVSEPVAEPADPTTVPTTGTGPGAVPVAPAPDQIRWNGASIYKQPVMAAVVDLEVWSSTPAAKVELLLGGVVVATDTTVEQTPDHWHATARVDLGGLEGPSSLTMRVTTPEGVVRSVAKAFTADPVVAPLTSGILARRPGPHNTGVPAGTVLRPSGTIRITQPGAVVDGLDIAGCVVVAANDVTIRNTRVRCTSTTRNRAVVMDGKYTGLLIEDVEIDGGGTTEIGIDLNEAVIRRVDIHGFNDGIRMGMNLVIEDSWIHHMTRRGSLHPDAIQGISARNIVIRNNTLDPGNPVTGDLANAAIMLGSESGPKISYNVLIEGNYMVGGNYTVNVSGSITAENIVIRNNRFGTGARYGAIITRQTVPAGPDNVWDATGTRVRVVYIK